MGKWDNRSILRGSFCLGRRSINGLLGYDKLDNAWKRWAAIMLMGKHYEKPSKKEAEQAGDSDAEEAV